ncbi:MAG: cupin domain-containing protein [Mycobacteriales bacterium]
MLVAADAAGRGGFADLLVAGDLDELISRRALRTPFLRVVKEGATLPASRYTRSAMVGSRKLDDLADPDRLFELYEDGATVVLQALHRSWPPLADFCRRLAAELGHPTQCNAYLTPPGSRGFDAHHDTHDVFVLQVDGTKRWKVYAPALPLPLRSQPSAAYAERGALLADDATPLISTVLRPGDVLYLPRGYIHAAETNADRSIHLTVGVQALTWYDILQDALTLAADEEMFRETLGTDLETAVPEFLRVAAKWVEGLPPDRIEELVRLRLARSIPAEPVRVLAQADAVRRLHTGTPVRLRPGLSWSLSGDHDRVVLHLRDRDISMPAVVEQALRRVLDGPAVTAADLATPELTVDDALVLLGRLLGERVLVG